MRASFINRALVSMGVSMAALQPGMRAASPLALLAGSAGAPGLYLGLPRGRGAVPHWPERGSYRSHARAKAKARNQRRSGR